MPIIFKVKHYLCAMFYQKMKNMKNYQFFESIVGHHFWIVKGTHVYIEEYNAELQAYYVFWFNVKGKQHHYLSFADMKSVRHCVFRQFGRESHSFKEWHSLVRLVKKCQPDEVLDQFSY